MKDSVRKIILLLFLFAGLSVLNYPFAGQLVNRRSQSTVIAAYEEEVEELSEERREELLFEAQAYNEALADAGQTAIQDAFSASLEESEAYEGLLDTDGDGMMGYLDIPSVHIALPIYHGTSADVLEKGAGHLEGTSLPIGGENVHAVISAHNGLPSKLMFTDLDRLQEGDLFFLTVLGERLAYRVEEIHVISPHETELLRITEGEDRVTLLTCTPYGVNSHRLLVQGLRTESEPLEREEPQERNQETTGKWEIGKGIFFASVAGFVLTAVILFLPKKKKRAAKREERPR